eukprot:255959-Amphidinium_carterae.1
MSGCCSAVCNAHRVGNIEELFGRYTRAVLNAPAVVVTYLVEVGKLLGVVVSLPVLTEMLLKLQMWLPCLIASPMRRLQAWMHDVVTVPIVVVKGEVVVDDMGGTDNDVQRLVRHVVRIDNITATGVNALAT